MTVGRTVDVHAHLAPDLDLAAVAELGVSEADGKYLLDGHQAGPTALYDARRLTGWLDRVRIDRAWVSVPPPFFRQGFDAGSTAAWVRAVNDGLVARLETQPRLEVLAYLPLDQPDVALVEIGRVRTCAAAAGWVGSAGGGSLPLDAPALAPVWSAIAASDLPILLHPGTSPDSRLKEHYLSNLLGNPAETTVAAAQLVFGNVLGTHLGLRPILVHCGGTVAALAGRWQRGADTRRPGVRELELEPRMAVRRFWVDVLAHDPAVVDLAIDVFGEDKLVLGSDWPFPMGLDDPWTAISHLPVDSRELIGVSNPAALRGEDR